MSRVWTPMPYFCGGRAYSSVFKVGILAMLSAVLLSGCGESTPSGYNGSASSDTLKPVAAPPGAEDQPPLPGTTGTQKTADGLPVLSAKGANTALFSTKMSSEVDRLDRLENAVQELRNDFDAMAPAIVRLVSIEKDLQNLIGQLDMLTNGAAAAPVPAIEESNLDVMTPPQPVDAPMPPTETAAPLADPVPPAPQSADPATLVPAQEPVAPPVTAAAPASPPAAVAVPTPSAPQQAAPAASGVNVSAIRIGEHPDKIRIVLDLTGKTGFRADLDNGEKILVVELDNAGWAAAAQKTFAPSDPLFSSYKTEKMGDNGTMLIVQLKKTSSIAYKSAVGDAAAGTGKIIIDLKK